MITDLTRLKDKVSSLQERARQRNSKIQTYETLLSEKSIAIKLLPVTTHAVDRYFERVGSRASHDILRRYIYKQMLKYVHVTEPLPDGNYRIDDRSVACVTNNHVCTVIKSKGK